MLRCYSGHFLCSAMRFRDLERKHGMIADMYCAGCDDYVVADSHDNMETMRRYVYLLEPDND